MGDQGRHTDSGVVNMVRLGVRNGEAIAHGGGE
jgi:hypothetical protein